MYKNVALILLSGGSGKRFSKKIPKQFFKINNKTLLEHNLSTFISFSIFSNITVVSSKKYLLKTQELCNQYKTKDLIIDIVLGGKTRQLSSKKGCQNLEQYSPDKVLIHDVARPFIDKDLISRLIETTKKNKTRGKFTKIK